MIIPFFIPHSGCPHQCVFCDQKKITGHLKPVGLSDISRQINEYLVINTSNRAIDVAFYGGSFTALPITVQQEYLEAVQPFITSSQIRHIRLSTRPDCITAKTLSMLNYYHANFVELGVQSMDDGILHRAGRGHTANDTRTAVELLRTHGFFIGLQLMVGLPGDTTETFMKTVDSVVRLKPDVVRIYPVLVIHDTPLEDLYRNGHYEPLSLIDAVALCQKALERFEQAGIDVIRIGLQATDELGRPGTITAGPYHPAFRQLVESSILLDRMRTALFINGGKSVNVSFQVHPKDLSAAISQHSLNIQRLKHEFGIQNIRFVTAESAQRRYPVLFSSA